jgi:hypothetical protein
MEIPVPVTTVPVIFFSQLGEGIRGIRGKFLILILSVSELRRSQVGLLDVKSK